MTDLKQAEQKVVTGAPIKFGLNQLQNATPAVATWVFRIVLYAVTISSIICNTVSEIPQPLKDLINHYGLEAVALVHLLSRFFGVDVSQYESFYKGNKS